MNMNKSSAKMNHKPVSSNATFLVMAVLLAAMPCSVADALEGPNEAFEVSRAPNVIVFLMDDMGYGDCRAYNPKGQVALPNIEKLATEGMTFTDAHAPSAVCAPTRYSVLTGNYPWRGRAKNGTWIFHQPSQVLRGQKTLGHLMQRAGYRTGFLGKVHLGGQVYSKSTGEPITWGYDFHDIDFKRPIENSPASFGFDYSLELPQGIQGAPYVVFENGLLSGDPSKLKLWEKGTYGESVISKDGFGSPDWNTAAVGEMLLGKAIGFIDSHLAANAKSGSRQPFFMHYCAESCHTPHTPPEMLGGVKIKGAAGDSHLDMLFEADVILGKIIDRLREEGELDNTLIIFTSDNGGLSRGKQGNERLGHDSNESLRGGKAMIFEGGHRVPLIAKWGDGTKEGSVIAPGVRTDSLVGLQDLFATMAELTLQDFGSDQGLDSESFLPVLVSDPDATNRDSLLVQANNEDRYGQRLMKMVRIGPWKLIATKELKPVQLYNLDEDLMETTNLIDAADQQEKVSELLAELKRIMASKRSTSPLNYSVRASTTQK